MNPLTDPLPPGPEHLGFILSRKCTARCGICYVRNEADIARGARRGDALPLFGSNDMPPGDMDPSLFSRILAAYPTVVGTDIAAIGETFDYPNFDEVFVRAYAFMPRIRSIGVTSNGGKLDLHMKIMAVPGFVTISVDSPDPAHCDVLRPGTDGARVWRNVSAAAALQQVRAVGINMILSRRNAHEIGAMADRLAPIGVKYLTVLRAIHLSGDVADDALERRRAHAGRGLVRL